MFSTYEDKNVSKFLDESNAIEGIYTVDALTDALSAWHYAVQNRHLLRDSTIHYILNIHKLLMLGLNPRIAGKLRECDVYVGNHHAKYKGELALIRSLETWYRIHKVTNETTHKKLIASHVAFEKIHPFEDGNGRVGRILYNIQRLQRGFDLHILLEKERFEYYKWFETASDRKKRDVDILALLSDENVL